jgi:glycosyltransferase involved in cell wall biosynthesis
MKKNIAIIENNIIATNTIRRKLTSALMEQGYNVVVLTTGKEAEIALARERGFNIIDVKSSNSNPLDILKYIRNIRRALKSFRPDVCLTFTIRPAIWGNMVTSGLNIPTITNITGVGPLFESKSIVYRAARTLYKFVLRKTKKIFFQNTDDRDLFLNHRFIKEEVAGMVPGSGIDHEFFKPMKPDHQPDHFVFLFISRLVKDKGVLEYVEAARIIRAEFPDVECRMLGPLWEQNLQSNIITKNDINDWVKEGAINYSGEATDVRPFIAEADSIVLPSYREGTSNVLLEASSMEKPCITCDTTGCREIVSDGNTGFLCKVADAQDLALQMKKMIQLTAADRERMGKMARQKVIREFDKQIVIDAYLKAISSVTA